MNLRTDVPMAKEAFLRWSERQDGRYEFVEGKIVMMTGASVNHNRVAGNLFGLLWSRLDPALWQVAQSDYAVEKLRGLRYPDVLAEPVGAQGSAYISPGPVLLAEVLSPSSLETDIHEKRGEYTALPSLQAYVVLAQDEPRLWLWQRGEDGVFPHAGEMIVGAEAVLALPALGVALSLAEMYRGVR